MTTTYTTSARIQSFAPGIKTFLVVCFWIWGLVGLLANTINYMEGMKGSVGVGTSAYVTVGMLYWIGGMILFGIGTLSCSVSYNFNRPNEAS
jgi:hypothetical protein